MTNAQSVEVYFGSLRELMRHAETLFERSELDPMDPEQLTSNRLYERDALTNFIGEAQCVIQEATRRIRYLETVVAEDV